MLDNGSHSPTNHTPVNTGNFVDVIGDIEHIYLAISGTSKQGAWQDFKQKLNADITRWSLQEVQVLNTLPGVQNNFQKDLELTNGYFNENDWNNLEQWYIKNRGTGEEEPILKDKFAKYRNNYEKKLQKYLIGEYRKVLEILIKRAQEPSFEGIPENICPLLEKISSSFPEEAKKFLKKKIKDRDSRNTGRNLKFETNSLTEYVQKSVASAMKGGSKTFKNIKKVNKKALGVFLLGGTFALGGGLYMTKTGMFGKTSNSIVEKDDTLTLNGESFSKLIKRKGIPWHILTNRDLMETIGLGCDTNDQKWWESILSPSENYSLEQYTIKENCTIKSKKGMNPQDIGFAYDIIQKGGNDETVTVSIGELRSLLGDNTIKEIFLALHENKQLKTAQVESTLHAARYIRPISKDDKTRKIVSLVSHLVKHALPEDKTIGGDSWKDLIDAYMFYLGETKTLEKFDKFSNTLVKIFPKLTLEAIPPDIEWPEIKGKNLMENPLFEVALNGIIEHFHSKIGDPSLHRDEVKQSFLLLIHAESGGKPKVKNTMGTSASGLFQILQSHMKVLGGGDKKIIDMNPIEQTLLFKKFIDTKFGYRGEEIKVQIKKLGVFAGWMGSAHIHDRWASEPRLQVSGFQNFSSYLTKQIKNMSSVDTHFSDPFKNRIQSARDILAKLEAGTKGIPQHMETPIMGDAEVGAILQYINIARLGQLRPTSGAFRIRNLRTQFDETQTGGGDPGKIHNGVDLAIDPEKNNITLLGNLLHTYDYKFDITGWGGYGNMQIEGAVLDDGRHLITLAAHLEKQAGEWHIGSSGRSTGTHLHFETFVVDKNGKGYRMSPVWSGNKSHAIDWHKGKYIKNPVDSGNAQVLYDKIIPMINSFQESKKNTLK